MVGGRVVGDYDNIMTTALSGLTALAEFIHTAFHQRTFEINPAASSNPELASSLLCVQGEMGISGRRRIW